MWRRWSAPLWLGLAVLLLGLHPSSALEARPDVGEPFRDYYNHHQGMRVLGYPITGLIHADGYPAQYFEKGRLEDHRQETGNPDWAFAFGRLTVELMDRDVFGFVNASAMPYPQIKADNDLKLRTAPPAGFHGGTTQVGDGVFIPFDARLQPAPGYIVPAYFWRYMNRADLFPGGWLHDFGLPLGTVHSLHTLKGHAIMMQAFERTVLTYDPLNPPDWQVERGNIGSDALRTLPHIEVPEPEALVTLPLHVQARMARSGETVIVALRWQNGTELTQPYNTLRGENYLGLVITNLDWPTPRAAPATQPATLEIRDLAGIVLAEQHVTVLNTAAPQTIAITLYWYDARTDQQPLPPLVPVVRHIPRTMQIGAASLSEMLWGPSPSEEDRGLYSAIPPPQWILNYPVRYTDWGPRVTLHRLTIENGVATAVFSPELSSFKGSRNTQLIQNQITRILLQFPTIREVHIIMEGSVAP